MLSLTEPELGTCLVAAGSQPRWASLIYTKTLSVLSRILGYALSQLRSMGPRWNFWRLILDLNSKFWKKKFCDRSLRKNFFFFGAPGNFFLGLVIFHFLEFNSKLHRISSTDFKFHLKICIRSGVITFWMLAIIFAPYRKNSKRYNSWTDAYF